MSILVQREFSVAPRDQGEFERRSREGVWRAHQHFGSLMIAYGRWGFDGPHVQGADSGSGIVVTNTVYTDFEHWQATRYPDGALWRNEALLEEAQGLGEIYSQRRELIQQSAATLLELDDEVSAPRPVRRRPGDPLPDAPPTFGPGSVVSQLTFSLRGSERDFLRPSQEQIWPWLEEQGGRLIGFGRNPLGPSSHVVTLFAFRSLAAWHRLSRPAAEDIQPPSDVEAAWNRRHELVQGQYGRLLIVDTEFGTPVE